MLHQLNAMQGFKKDSPIRNSIVLHACFHGLHESEGDSNFCEYATVQSFEVYREMIGQSLRVGRVFNLYADHLARVSAMNSNSALTKAALTATITWIFCVVSGSDLLLVLYLFYKVPAEDAMTYRTLYMLLMDITYSTSRNLSLKCREVSRSFSNWGIYLRNVDEHIGSMRRGTESNPQFCYFCKYCFERRRRSILEF